MTRSRRRRAQDRIPIAIRWRLRLALRRVADLTSGVRFAGPSPGRGCLIQVARYELPLRCYAGQEHRFAGKRGNLELAFGALDGIVVRPGEVLSFWQSVGRPTRAAGYAVAAAIKGGLLVEDVGGAICLASTVIYNAGLLSGLTVVERYCHSVDSYGEDRYFELGRDAAVEFPYRDLRLRNDLGAALLLRTSVSDGAVRAEVWSHAERGITVEIVVSPTLSTETGELDVLTERLISINGASERHDLGWSAYRTP